MSELQNHVNALRVKLAHQEALLAQQKNAVKEKEERSWGFNMKVLENMYEDKKLGADTRIGELKKIESYNNRHPHLKGSEQDKSLDAEIAQQKKSYEQDAALFHLFHHLGDELWRIECKIQRHFNKLDERLTHIEQFLTDDIKKEEFLENKSQNYRTVESTGHNPPTSPLPSRKIKYSNTNTRLSSETREAMRD